MIKFLFGSKLGSAAPSEKAVLVLESSDKMATWLEPAKEDVTKFMTCIERDCASFNAMLFSGAGLTPYVPVPFTPTFPEGKVKKGSADCIKWITKQYNPKALNATPWPPDWLGLIEALCKEDLPK